MRWLARRRTAALWRAVQERDAGAVVKLLAQAADVNARDDEGNTGLALASRSDQLGADTGHAMVQLLRQHGAQE